MKTVLIPAAAFLLNILLTAAELDILCTTDLHGHFEQIPAIASVFRRADKEALKIDVGDTLSGTFYSEHYGGAPVIRLLNRLAYDVWVPGNHDFEMGYGTLERRVRKFKGTVLGAQWHWGNIRPVQWKLFKRQGVRVAVIGLTDPAMPGRILPGHSGVFRDGHEVLKKIMPEILAARPHVIILAYHNGEYSRFGNTFILSRTFPEIDIILGGHSHQEIPGKRVGNAWFVQPGPYGKNAAHIKVFIDDRSGRIRKITSALHAADTGKRDPALEARCREMTLEQERLSHTPLVPSGKKIVTTRAAVGQWHAEALKRASGGGAAMVQRPEVKSKGRKKHYRNNVVGVGNAGDVYRLFPFNNRICLVTVGQKDLEELESFIRTNAGKRRVRYFFAGDISQRKDGRLIMQKKQTTLAVSDFLLVSTPVLQRKLSSRELWQLIPGLTERQIALEMLRSRIASVSAE